MNSSTIRVGRHSKFANDTSVFHPYVVDEKKQMVMNGERANWTTSKITRRRDKLTGKIIVKVKIVNL